MCQVVGVMGGERGAGAPRILSPAPGWECAVGVGTPGSYFWFGDWLAGVMLRCREDGNSCGVSQP